MSSDIDIVIERKKVEIIRLKNSMTSSANSFIRYDKERRSDKEHYEHTDDIVTSIEIALSQLSIDDDEFLAVYYKMMEDISSLRKYQRVSL